MEVNITETVVTTTSVVLEWNEQEVTFELEENYDGEEREYFLTIYDELGVKRDTYPNIEKKHYKELLRAFKKGLSKGISNVDEALEYMNENW